MLNQARSLLLTAFVITTVTSTNQVFSQSSNIFQDNLNLEFQSPHSSSTETVHAIVHIIASGFLIDFGILVSFFFSGRKITFRGQVIPAQAFHGVIMTAAVVMSGILTIVMQNRSDAEKQLPNELYNGKIGYVIGILSVIQVPLGLLNYGYMKNYNIDMKSKFVIPKLHKLVGIIIFFLTKANFLLAPKFDKDRDWKNIVYIYLVWAFCFVLVIPGIIRKHYWVPRRLAQIVETPSSQPMHKNLLAAINSGYATEDIIQQFPGVKWIMLGNKVYDLTGWIHPAANFSIEAIVGTEFGRYFYGNYALEGTLIPAYQHSSLSHAQLSTFYIGEIKGPESILLSSRTRKETFSHWDSNWKVRSIKSVSPTISQIDFTCDNFLVKNFGTSLSWLGAHFKVSFAKDDSIARLYTAAMCLNDSNYHLRMDMYRYFDEVMAGTPSTFKYSQDSLAPQDHLPLFIKKYTSSKRGFSTAIHKFGLDTPIRIEGPILSNMTFSPKAKGEYCIICAGTGILSIIDFLNYFLWQSMYETIKDKAGTNKAEQINILKLPFNDMKHLKVDFIGAFPNKDEILGLDIIKKLAEISKKFKKNNFRARIKGYSDENIEGLQQHFTFDFLSKNVNLNQTRYYVVGPRQLNEQVTEALVSLGVPKRKVVLL